MEFIDLSVFTEATRMFVQSPTKDKFDDLSRADRASLVDVISQLNLALTEDDGYAVVMVDASLMEDGLRAFYAEPEGKTSLGQYDELHPTYSRQKARAAQEACKATITAFLIGDMQERESEAFALNHERLERLNVASMKDLQISEQEFLESETESVQESEQEVTESETASVQKPVEAAGGVKETSVGEQKIVEPELEPKQEPQSLE